MKRIKHGYQKAKSNQNSVEDDDLEKVKCRITGKVFRSLMAYISPRKRDRQSVSIEH